jgi:homoserine dehydrogenase
MVTKVGLVGLGTVGGEVCRRLIDRRDSLSARTGTELTVSAVAEPEVPDDLQDYVSELNYYETAEELLDAQELDILVELIGGMKPAEQIVRDALEAGTDVVTANKELLAHSGEELFELARIENQRIRFEAGVGGCIPIVRTIREAMVDVDFSAIYGIINGTSNYVLSRMRRDEISFEDALHIAQEKGFAEADPSYDVEGTDTVHKLIILSELAFGTSVDYDDVYCEGIKRITPEIIQDAHQFGYRIKLLGIAKQKEEGLEARVHPTLIPDDSPLAAVEEQYNAVLTQGEPVGTNMLTGKGAGGAPTATAIISDLVSLSRDRETSRIPYLYSEKSNPTIPISQIESRFYLRLMAKDRPGVLSRVTKILGDREISIDSVLQVGRSQEELVPVILTTHRARESQMNSAVDEIAKLDSVGREPICLHIEEGLDSE